MVDEVRTGLGRTGEMFAIDGEKGVVPDSLTLVKGPGNGIPLEFSDHL